MVDPPHADMNYSCKMNTWVKKTLWGWIITKEIPQRALYSQLMLFNLFSFWPHLHFFNRFTMENSNKMKCFLVVKFEYNKIKMNFMHFIRFDKYQNTSILYFIIYQISATVYVFPHSFFLGELYINRMD